MSNDGWFLIKSRHGDEWAFQIIDYDESGWDQVVISVNDSWTVVRAGEVEVFFHALGDWLHEHGYNTDRLPNLPASIRIPPTEEERIDAEGMRPLLDKVLGQSDDSE